MTSSTRIRVLAAGAILACLPIGQMIAAERSIAAMSQAATKFLAELTPEQRQQATFAMTAEERLRWHFIPNEMFPRKGLSFRTMTEAQKARAHDLLKAGLSQRGYSPPPRSSSSRTSCGPSKPAAKMARDPLDYQFSVFGTPGDKSAWGWRVEGHHLSLHFTISGNRRSATSPTFIGSNPAEVRDGPEEGPARPRGAEDTGRAMVMALDEAQRKAAIYDDVAPSDILTMTRTTSRPLPPAGRRGLGDDAEAARRC